ncbi:hypothetical protein, partial [Bacillus sp. OTU530]|uniref:hypothetical protein n=1 Tax=Bacillus sp. OTU530 TaxID=3043862 RepID=UPI00313E3543
LTARHTLMVEYHELWKERYENTKAKYEKFKQNPNVNHRSFHILGLQNKMERQLKHIQFYEQHILQHTFPSVVFGGRKNFEELRNGRMSSRGDATKGGNPNKKAVFRITSCQKRLLDKVNMALPGKLIGSCRLAFCV